MKRSGEKNSYHPVEDFKRGLSSESPEGNRFMSNPSGGFLGVIDHVHMAAVILL